MPRCDAASLVAVAYGLLATIVYIYLIAPSIVRWLSDRGTSTISMAVLIFSTIAYMVSILLAIGLADTVCFKEEL